MRRLAAALLLALTACGGGSKEPRSTPATTPAATSSAPLVTPEAQKVRDAVAKTLAACPCEVEVWGGAMGTAPYRITLRGVYDPKAQTSELRELENGKPTGVVFRIVDGRTFMDPELKRWLELDFSGMPKKAVSVLAAATLADPRLAFAVGSHVSVATEANATAKLGTLYDVEYDVAATSAAAGPSADLLKRLVPSGSVYDSLFLRDGALHRLSFKTPDSPAGDDAMSVTMTILKTGVAAPAVTVPQPIVNKVDVATFTGS